MGFLTIFATLTHQSGSVSVAATLAEVSGVPLRFFMRFALPVLFPLRHKFTNSQMYILPGSNDMNKVQLQSEGYFSLARQDLDLVKRHGQIFDCNSIHSIWNFTSNVFMLTENEVTNKLKNWWFFCNLEISSQIPPSKWKSQLHIFCCS